MENRVKEPHPVISQEQALATAERWLNGHAPQEQHRRIGIQEFDLGWVVWAVPPPVEVDPVTGQRRPPADFGNASGVVDRRTGELTVWPSVPVDEVIGMYQAKHGAGADASQAPPVTGPGNTAVFSYVDPANGEESTLFRTSAPGQPPAEYQVWAELQRMGVPAGNVVAVHTDLRPSLLPGGYTGDLILSAFPNASFSCSQDYGMRPEERAEGIAALIDSVESMHRAAGQQPPPRPHRLPVPSDVPATEPVRDVALGRELVEALGPDGVRRYDADDLAGTELPEPAVATLTWAGLPADIPFFFAADRPDGPVPGGLFTDAATHLRERGTEASAKALETLAGHVRIGSDGLCVITVQCRGSERWVGSVWAIHPLSGTGRFINQSVSAFDRSLALLVETRKLMDGMNPVEAGAAVAAFQEKLAALDPTALGDVENWWTVVTEQMWHGLF
ncbi:SUKH-4 family immunity protein [Streptomyces sp. NBC_01262]|uniref:SUKH-4 family immunity protein n=1 Tax=Streptomyces sp. NBC_01262 TaxID=2903803 RepID=UPI002E37D4C3|nr:SUKH-4 family immunity protein [Streptomyces sp. NBC_01262]